MIKLGGRGPKVETIKELDQMFGRSVGCIIKREKNIPQTLLFSKLIYVVRVI